jgi:hypothetical protein
VLFASEAIPVVVDIYKERDIPAVADPGKPGMGIVLMEISIFDTEWWLPRLCIKWQNIAELYRYRMTQLAVAQVNTDVTSTLAVIGSLAMNCAGISTRPHVMACLRHTTNHSTNTGSCSWCQEYQEKCDHVRIGLSTSFRTN